MKTPRPAPPKPGYVGEDKPWATALFIVLVVGTGGWILAQLLARAFSGC